MATTGTYVPITPVDPTVYERGTRSVFEGATDTSKRGTPKIYTSGLIGPAGTSPSVIAAISAEDGHNATSGTKEEIIWPLNSSDQYYCTVLETLAQSSIGTDVGLVKDSTTGLWYGSTADAGAQAYIVDYVRGPAGFAIGDAKWLAKIKFHAAKIQYN